MNPINPYQLLDVDETIEDNVLRKRYKTVSKMIHPDKHNQDGSSVFIFQLVKSAYENIKASRQKMIIPKISVPKVNKIEEKTNEIEVDVSESNAQQNEQQKKNPIVPGTNITENDIKILGQLNIDPWFNPNFSLTEFFGDVEIPEKNKNKTNNMRPQSTRR